MSKIKVTQEQVEQIFQDANTWVQTIWDKCTVVACQLPNGFIIVESSACVDVENYDAELGESICVERIKNKIWELEGYMLQEYEYRKGNLN